jgi:hypothetical protein
MEMTEHASEIVTVIDPRHPLCGQSFRLLGIAMKNQLGRCCVVLDHAGRERNLPIAVTDHSPDLLAIAPFPLTVATITSLIDVSSHICPQPGTDMAVGEEDGRERPHESQSQPAHVPTREPADEPDLNSSPHSKRPGVDRPLGTTAADGGGSSRQDLSRASTPSSQANRERGVHV